MDDNGFVDQTLFVSTGNASCTLDRCGMLYSCSAVLTVTSCAVVCGG